MVTRIYIVSDLAGKNQRLVRAQNRAQALKHVAAASFNVEVANQDTLIELLGKHVDIERATPEQEDLVVASIAGNGSAAGILDEKTFPTTYTTSEAI